MNEKRLPIKERPVIKTFNHSAVCIGVLDANGIQKDEWLCVNFLNLYWNKGWNAISVNKVAMFFYQGFKWKFNLFFIWNRIFNTRLIKTVVRNIDANRYVCLMVNEKYIPNRFYFKRKNYLHDLYIYGYDLNKENFYIYGYDSNFKLYKSEIAFRDVINALRTYFLFPMISFYPKMTKIELNYDKIYNSLKKYIHPKFNNYGHKVYDHVLKKLNNPKTDWIDIRDFSVIREHIYIIKTFMQLINYKGNIEKLSEKADLMYLKAIKYKVSKNSTLREEIANDLKTYADEEYNEMSLLAEIVKAKIR